MTLGAILNQNSIFDMVFKLINKYSRLKEENPALLE